MYLATVLSPEYLVMLLPENEDLTTLDWFFNRFFCIFHPESDVICWFLLDVTP